MLIPVAFLVLLVALGTVSTAENTSPTVEVHTPEEGAALGLAVTVSGKAIDAEGFNIESYVEARWNDWEWFRLPDTPTDGNRSIVFGEMVNLDWHSPGEHMLQVRAFDGELFSDVAQVNVTVRDLPDLVILPTDISLDPDHVEGDEPMRFHVVVENQGGEEITDVQVRLMVDGVERDGFLLGVVEADSQKTVVLKTGLPAGTFEITVSAYSLQVVEERSQENNEAGRTFTFSEPEDKWETGWGMYGILFALVVVLIWLGVFIGYRSVLARKD
jgi:hypothetical protein